MTREEIEKIQKLDFYQNQDELIDLLMHYRDDLCVLAMSALEYQDFLKYQKQLEAQVNQDLGLED